MSDSVDDRVVAMKFDNATFESGVKTTLGTLGKLKSSLNFSGSEKGLDTLQASASKFSLEGMANATTHISAGFASLATIGITALANITNKAVDAGIQIAKSFTTGPIGAGFKNYETQINAVQTILANTGLKGSAGLNQVNKALANLNTYANKTIYNFSDMAKSIGTFTAAGVKLSPATDAIKGIANLAAASGASADQASGAMYQLSQALAAGTFKLQDYNSVVNAGIGGKLFQTAIFNSAKAAGTLKGLKLDETYDQWTKAGNNFRSSLKDGYVTTKVLTQALASFTGDESAQKLKSLGYTAKQIEQTQQTARLAVDAATKIKTFSQLTDALKEEVATAYAAIFKTIFGNINQARTLFSAVHTSLENALTQPIYAFNSLLEGATKLGARSELIDGIRNALKALGAVMKPIAAAFHEIFPPTTAKDIADIISKFDDFTKTLIIGKTTSDNLKRTFAGFFAVLDIGKQILIAAAKMVVNLFGAASGGSGSILNLTGNIGDFLVSLDKAIKKGQGLTNFFGTLGDILVLPIKLISAFAGALSNISVSVSPSVLNAIGKAFGNIGSSIQGLVKGGDINVALAGLSTGILGGIFIIIKLFIGRLTTLFNGGLFGGGGLINTVKDTFETLTGSLKAMQTEIQAKTLLLIAGALALLTASVLTLSFIDPKKIAKSLGAITVAFAQLLGAMAILVKISGSAGFVKVPLLAASMVLLSTSILILVAAIALMGQLDWTTIVKGLAGIAGALVVIAGGMRLMPKGMTLQAAALVLIGAALTEIGLAIAGIGLLSGDKIAKGLIGMAGALALIAGAIELMPPTMIAQALGLKVVGKALIVIAAAIGLMGLMSGDQIAKGLVTLGGALLILAAGLELMTGTLLGSAALLIAAGALAILAPALVILGTLSWMAIAKGMAVLAGAFAILGIAGLLLAPLELPILGLATALLAIGAGMALAGVGALALATAFSIFAAAGTAGIAVVAGLIGLIPAFLTNVAKGIVDFAVEIGSGGAQIVKAFVTLASSILDAIVTLVPKIPPAMKAIITAMIKVLQQNAGRIASEAINLLVTFVTAIAKNMFRIVSAATSVIVNFLLGLGKNAGRIADAGFNMLIDFINGITKAVNKHSGALGTAGGNLAVALVQGMVDGIGKYAYVVVDAAKNMATSVLHGIAHVLDSHSPSRETHKLGMYADQGLANGLTAYSSVVKTASEDVAGTALDTMQYSLSKIPDALSDSANMNPVISPVLDLTKFQNDATKINGLLAVSPINAGVSYNQASTISTATAQAAKNAAEVTSPAAASAVAPKLEFNQYNNSPESLSTTEIYRQTKNQLSQVKKVLEIV